jgi:hypothetical protein
MIVLEKEMTMTIQPQCFDCKHLQDGPPPHCAAFPDEIPMEILLNKFDHKKPHPGDHGIRFEAGVPAWMEDLDTTESDGEEE